MVDTAVIDASTEIKIKQADNKIRKLEFEILTLRNEIKTLDKNNIRPDIQILEKFGIEKHFLNEFNLFSAMCKNSNTDVKLLKNSSTIIYLDCARIIEFVKEGRDKWNEIFNLCSSLNKSDIRLKTISNIHTKLSNIEENFYFIKTLSQIGILDLFNIFKNLFESFDSDNLEQFSTLVLYSNEINKSLVNNRNFILKSFINSVISLSRNTEKIEKLVDSLTEKLTELKVINNKKNELIEISKAA